MNKLLESIFCVYNAHFYLLRDLATSDSRFRRAGVTPDQYGKVARVQILTAVLLKIQVFWDVTSC
jgi:hypothetical protein